MRRLYILLLIVLISLAGCRQTEEPVTLDDIDIDIELAEADPSVGIIDLLVTITETESNTPIEDATVTVRADMAHAGMVPYNSFPVTENDAGVYAVPIEFTMGGDWLITVEVELADGDSTTVDYEVDAVASNGDSSDMDMQSASANSAAYFTVTNTGDEAITLIDAMADGVGTVQIHQTTVDENDVARMQQLEDGLLIPAGATIALMPGDLHLMLMNIEQDLVEGETLAITLEFDNDSSVTFDAPIALSLPEDEVAEVNNGDLTLTGFWARPATLMAMEMDTEAESTEEAE